jgi:membrane protein implicated in regulation of membrane protease activity
MLDFFRFLIAPENILFLISLLAFAGLWVLQIFALAGEGLEAGLEGGSDKVKVPTIFFLNALFVSFGVLGFFITWLLPHIISVALPLQVVLSVFFSAGISWLFAGQFANWLGQIHESPPNATPVDFEGCVGKVISQHMTSEMSARVSVTHSVYGNYKLRGRVAVGYQDLEHGDQVRIYKYDKDEEVYFCVPLSEWPQEAGR